MANIDKTTKITDWNNSKPVKNQDWAEDVKEESFHVKLDHQLDKIEKVLTNKIPKISKMMEKISNYPDAIKYELREDLLKNGCAESDLQLLIEEKFNDLLNFYNWKIAKINQSIDRVKKEKELRNNGFLSVMDKKNNDPVFFEANTPEGITIRSNGGVIRAPIGTTYYIDADNGNDTNDGLGTGSGNAWATLHKFTENARSPGDIVKIRRGTTARIDDGGSLAFTSDGDINNPIVIEADFDDSWSDFANSTQTYTLVFGSKTVEASATITDISAGDWIYNSTDGDDPREFSYEVASVSGTTITLKLPFKGSTGTTKTLKIMPPAPIWGATTSFSYNWGLSLDDYWEIRNIHVKTTNTSGAIDCTSTLGHIFKDLILETGAGTSSVIDPDCGLFLKCRINGNSNSTTGISPTDSEFFVKDSLIENCSTRACYASDGLSFIDCEFNNNAIDFDITSGRRFTRVRNCKNNGTTVVYKGIEEEISTISFEDYNNTPGDNRNLGLLVTASDTPIFQSETTKVRSGGGNVSIKVTPITSLGSSWEWSRWKIFEIPIYATTDSKTYTIYFASDDNTDWDSNPTASELWIELEAWGHVSNNFRKITKSTGTVDFQTDTDFDQSLSITFAPAQSGLAYLRMWYAKPKESTNANIFYIDPVPVIS